MDYCYIARSSNVQKAMRYGVARGLFSNEAGMGSTPHAHAAAEVAHPADQGLIAMMGVFIDTFIILTITALVILSTGVLGNGETGSVLAQSAFNAGLGTFGPVFIAFCMLFFAFTTIVGWYYFGEVNVRALFGDKAVKVYAVIVILCVAVGSTLKVDLVWNMSDMFNGLMVLPNLIALLPCVGIVKKLTKEYEKYLLLIIGHDSFYRDENMMSAMERTLKGTTADTLEKFFKLYRADNFNLLNAYIALSEFYQSKDQKQKALHTSALGALTGFTKVLGVVSNRNPEYKYTDLGSLFVEVSLYSDIIEWGIDNSVWKGFYQFAEQALKNDYPVFAKQLFSVLEIFFIMVGLVASTSIYAIRAIPAISRAPTYIRIVLSL